MGDVTSSQELIKQLIHLLCLSISFRAIPATDSWVWIKVGPPDTYVGNC